MEEGGGGGGGGGGGRERGREEGRRYSILDLKQTFLFVFQCTSEQYADQRGPHTLHGLLHHCLAKI